MHEHEPKDDLGADQCPHLDRNDRRCASRFRLNGLDEMFSVCCGAFRACQLYHRMNLEQSLRVVDAETGLAVSVDKLRLPEPAAASRAVDLTRDGRPVRLRLIGS